MTDAPLVISPERNGPPGSGQGGYVCGMVAARLDGPAEVTLRRPAPLGTPLAVERDEAGAVRLLHDGALVAEGAPAPRLELELPEPVGVAQAADAMARSRLHARPDSHPAPTCFVCGPMREDGMRIHVGPVDGRGLSAGTWVPGPELTGTELAGPDGALAPELVWAVLDCPGGLGAFGDGELTGPPYLLGRFAARQDGPVELGEPHVVMGWRLAEDGRKLMAGSAIFTAAGQPVAAARATWIRLRHTG
jgi:hypothetical protein